MSSIYKHFDFLFDILIQFWSNDFQDNYTVLGLNLPRLSVYIRNICEQGKDDPRLTPSDHCLAITWQEQVTF